MVCRYCGEGDCISICEHCWKLLIKFRRAAYHNLRVCDLILLEAKPEEQAQLDIIFNKGLPTYGTYSIKDCPPMELKCGQCGWIINFQGSPTDPKQQYYYVCERCTKLNLIKGETYECNAD